MKVAPLRPAASAQWVALILVAAMAGVLARLAWIEERLGETPRKSGWRAQARLEPPLSGVAWLHDEQLYYLSTAVNQFQGRGFFPDYNRIRDGLFVPPPLQSFLILSVFRIAGRVVAPYSLLALQALAAGFMVFVIAETVRRLSTPGAGLVAAVLAALHPDLVLWSGYLLTESNYLVGLSILVLALVIWAERPSTAAAFGAALVLGLLNLERANALGLGPLLAFFAVRRLGFRRGWVTALVFLLVPMAVLLPWRQRNLRVYGEPIWVSSNLGVFLYIANSPALDARATPFMDEANRGGRLRSPEIEARLRARDGRLRVTYYRYSEAYGKAFRESVRRDPLHFARNYVIKAAVQFWAVPESRPVSELAGLPLRDYKTAQRLLIILGFAGLAAALALRPSHGLKVCVVLFAYFAAAGGVVGTDLAGRYGVVPRLLLMIFFTAGLGCLLARPRKRSR